MVDTSALGSWIQSQHLDEEALERYRQEFSAHPGRLIVLKDFLVEAVAEKLSRFLTTEAEFKVEHGLYSVEGAVPEEQWAGAQQDDRFFRLSKLAGTPSQFQLSPNTLTYLRFRKEFLRPHFRTFFEALTGLPLGSSEDFGIHSMRTGDFLRPHSDDNQSRQIALVIYFSPEWKPAFGGALKVIDRDGNATDVQPEYNSIVVFDVMADTTHLVEPIQPAAGDLARLSIGGWYPKPD